jgi:hypothetical protein
MEFIRNTYITVQQALNSCNTLEFLTNVWYVKFLVTKCNYKENTYLAERRNARTSENLVFVRDRAFL